jgi:hypothetical protein
VKEFNISKIDFENARILLDQEKLKQFTVPELFKAGIYCILAQAERYDKQINIYRKLLNAGIDSPGAVFQKKNKLRNILKKTHYPNLKETRIKNFSGWWVGAAIPHAILKDIGNGRNKGVKLRNDILPSD